jgi:hypothetical protein
MRVCRRSGRSMAAGRTSCARLVTKPRHLVRPADVPQQPDAGGFALDPSRTSSWQAPSPSPTDRSRIVRGPFGRPSGDGGPGTLPQALQAERQHDPMAPCRYRGVGRLAPDEGSRSPWRPPQARPLEPKAGPAGRPAPAVMTEAGRQGEARLRGDDDHADDRRRRDRRGMAEKARTRSALN